MPSGTPSSSASGESCFVPPARTTGKGRLRQGRTKPERRGLGCLSSEVVGQLDLPAPLAVVPGMPPALEDAGLSARQDHQPPQVGLGGPAVLQPDAVTLADQI